MRWAFLCRYGGQDIYRLAARDPKTEPLTPIEEALFARAIKFHMDNEFAPASAAGAGAGA